MYFPKSLEAVTPIGKVDSLKIGKNFKDFREAELLDKQRDLNKVNFNLVGFRYGDVLSFCQDGKDLNKLFGFSLIGTYREN